MANGQQRTGPEWTTAITTLSLIVTIAFVTVAMYWAQVIFIPIALAVVGTFILSPAVSRLQRWGCGRTTAVLLVVLLSGLTMVSVGVVVGQQLGRLGDTLPDYKPNILAKVDVAKTWLLGKEKSRLTQLGEDVAEVVAPETKTRKTSEVTIWGIPVPAASQPQRVVVEPQANSWFDNIWRMVGPVGAVVGTLALTGVLIVFMLLRREDLRNRMIRLIGHGRVTLTTKAVDDAGTRISRYLLTQLGLNAAFGLVISLGLLLIGLEYAALWGFIAFLMRYVPYIGTWIGVIPPVLFSLAISDGWSQPLTVFALFIGLEMLCNNIFEPMLYSSSLGLSEVAQLVAAAFWAFLWGPIGLILSGPLTVCLLVLGKYVPRLEFLEVLLGDEPALSRHMAFYQRLVARDQDEAANIALAAMKEKDVKVMYDEVLLPALALAKRDYQADLLTEENWKQAIRVATDVVQDVESYRTENDAVVEADDTVTSRIPVLLMPAQDEVDQLAVEILMRRLDSSRWDAEVLPIGTLASELGEAVRKRRPAAVVLASLPPKGFSHTRYLVNRIRSADADVKILVGRWGFSEELGEPANATGIEGVDMWADTLEAALTQLREWAPVFRESADSSPGETRRTTPKNGTPIATVSVR